MLLYAPMVMGMLAFKEVIKSVPKNLHYFYC